MVQWNRNEFEINERNRLPPILVVIFEYSISEWKRFLLERGEVSRFYMDDPLVVAVLKIFDY